MSKSADEVIFDLDRLNDDAFVLDFCLNALFPDFENSHRILQYAIARIYQINKRINDSSASSIAIDYVFKMLKRLGTFRAIYRGVYQVENWFRFRSCNLLKEICQLTSQSEMNTALTIWRRHAYGNE